MIVLHANVTTMIIASCLCTKGGGGWVGFPLEHRFLCLVHVLTVAHVLTPVNVHHC